MDRESATGVAPPVAGVVSNGKERCDGEEERAGKAHQPAMEMRDADGEKEEAAQHL